MNNRSTNNEMLVVIVFLVIFYIDVGLNKQCINNGTSKSLKRVKIVEELSSA